MKQITRRTYPDLRTWRKARGFGQREAADFLDISQTYYSRLERRVQAMRGKRAKIVTGKTGVPIEVLVGAA